MAAPTAEPVRSPLVEALAAVDLADAARPGGIRAGVEQAADIIRAHVAAWSEGADAEIVPLPVHDTPRSAA